MPKQIHSPEEKDRMISDIDHVREKRGLTLPRACAEVAPKYKKTAQAMLSMYNYWKAYRAGKAYMVRPKKGKPTNSPKRVEDITRAIQEAVNAESNKAEPEGRSLGGSRTRETTIRAVTSFSGKTARRALRMKYLQEMLRLLDEEENHQETDPDGASSAD